MTLLRKGRILIPRSVFVNKIWACKTTVQSHFAFIFFSFVLGHNFQLSALSAECQPFYNCCSMSTPLKLPYVSCLTISTESTRVGLRPFALPVLLLVAAGWWFQLPGQPLAGMPQVSTVALLSPGRSISTTTQLWQWCGGWAWQVGFSTSSLPSLPGRLGNQKAIAWRS